MKKLYQTSWHGIPFTSFTQVSRHKIADTAFYDRFYRAFFQQYHHASDLDPEWIRLKRSTIERLRPVLFPSPEARILSVGCGLGVIETYLAELGYSNLEVCEVTDASLKWIRKVLSPEQIHVGPFPDGLPAERLYDRILLSSVDYTMDNSELRIFLTNVLNRLAPRGSCHLLAYSLESSGRLLRVWDRCRELLGTLTQKDPVQFWGYVRSREDYQAAFRRIGFETISDEIVPTGTRWTTYRITGERSKPMSVPIQSSVQTVNA